jgi:signal recognition particle GTPase
MLDNLTARLAKIVKQIRGEARLTEENIQDALREVRVALLEADVALPVVKDFIAASRTRHWARMSSRASRRARRSSASCIASSRS